MEYVATGRKLNTYVISLVKYKSTTATTIKATLSCDRILVGIYMVIFNFEYYNISSLKCPSLFFKCKTSQRLIKAYFCLFCLTSKENIEYIPLRFNL